MKSIWPSPCESATLIMASTSSSLKFSPNFFITFCNSEAEISPFPSLSKKLKSKRSTLSVAFVKLVSFSVEERGSSYSSVHFYLTSFICSVPSSLTKNLRHRLEGLVAISSLLTTCFELFLLING